MRKVGRGVSAVFLVGAMLGASGSVAAAAEAVQGIDANNNVTIGAWIAQTGPLASVASCYQGAQFKVDQVNEAGGINGYTFTYNVIDDQADPTKTVAAVTKLWEQDKVFALVTPYGSGPFAAVKGYLLDNQVPVIAPYANSVIMFGTDGNTAPPDVFGSQASYLAEVKALAQFAAEVKGFTKVAVLHTTDEYGQTGSDGLNEAAADLGITVVGDFGYDTTETNFAPLGQRAAASGAEAILVWGVAGVTQVVNAAEQAGFEGTWLLNDVFRTQANLNNLTNLANMADRSYMIYHQKLNPQMTAAGSTFVADFQARYPSGDPDTALTCYTSMAIFMKAVEEATAGGAQLTWPAIRSTLEQWTDVSVEAAVGLTYSPERHIGAEQAQIFLLTADGTWEVAQDFQALPR